MLSARGGVARRAVWSVTSQGVSSFSNFLLTITVLAAATRHEFAIFSFCITTYLLVSQLARSVSALPLMILYSDGDPLSESSDSPAAVGVSVLVGLASAIVLVVVAIATGREVEQFAILAAGMPLLLFQDALRHLAFARSRPQVAAANDGLRLALQATASLLAWLTGEGSVPVLLGVWTGSGIVAGLVAAKQLHTPLTMSGSFAWLGKHRALCEKLAYEFLMNSGSFYLLLYGLALLAGISELGRFRAAQTLIGPVIVILLAGNTLGIPEGVKARGDRIRLRRMSLVLSAGLAAAALAWGLAVYALLPTIGPALFESSWKGARPLIPVLTVFAAGVGVSTGATSALRALGESSWILTARGLTGALTLVLGLPLSRAVGARGALYALALSETLIAVAAWVRLARSQAEAGIEEEAPAFVPV